MKTISLFSGAGGLDVGFKKAGFNIVWANDFDKDACETYKLNIGSHILYGDINELKNDLFSSHRNIDVVIGGPPCQGFSVAGKMDPHDPRSQHVWSFVDIVKTLRPKAFVMENVKALGKLKKWELLRKELLKEFRKAGYSVNFIVLNATNFNVPQARERVFFIGFKTKSKIIPDLEKMMEPYQKTSPTVREALSVLDKAGTGNNKSICKAKITITSNPVLRKSPYAGMLFNGLGRPVKIDGFCATLPASMGGNKTPIIDENVLYKNEQSWVEEYHKTIMNGESTLAFQKSPPFLRRLTVEECEILQTFPKGYKFYGSQSSRFRQIGNAVPCNLAYSVAQMVINYIDTDVIKIVSLPFQLKLAS